ncbi:hypothetical protein TNCV_4660351 [Trichonephila clavipes]|uniref:Uncharacterized protein n=1 Tax=Trichonephila clavipes TaxID=2585209 RepID=A0A8X6V8H3_TRICX|nr:hypothetical protein TNCV_4660351 [Trichonephila clavipes]
MVKVDQQRSNGIPSLKAISIYRFHCRYEVSVSHYGKIRSTKIFTRKHFSVGITRTTLLYIKHLTVALVVSADSSLPPLPD